MAIAATYPSDVSVFIDEQDVTKLIFGVDTIDISDLNREWRDIDITSFIRYSGLHTLVIKAGSGTGRVDARIEMR